MEPASPLDCLPYIMRILDPFDVAISVLCGNAFHPRKAEPFRVRAQSGAAQRPGLMLGLCFSLDLPCLVLRSLHHDIPASHMQDTVTRNTSPPLPSLIQQAAACANIKLLAGHLLYRLLSQIATELRRPPSPLSITPTARYGTGLVHVVSAGDRHSEAPKRYAVCPL